MLKKLLGLLGQLKTLAPVYAFFGGRHTFFAIFFAVTGFYLAATGKLSAQYVALITALQAFVLGHSIKEDVSGKGQ